MKPRDAKTFKQFLELQSDNHAVVEGWILLNEGSVTLQNQKSGERPTGSVNFSRRAFKALVDWYNRDQKRSPSKR